MWMRHRPMVDVGLLTALLRDPRAVVALPRPGQYLVESARGALRWLLGLLRTRRGGKPLRVGVQAFTCRVTLQAIGQSGNRAVLHDIDTDYYSAPRGALGDPDVDVLILTHLYGIPHPDYVEIASVCRAKDIILIDDACLTRGSSIDGIEVGTQSDYALHSLGFDKPVSAYAGGELLDNRGDIRETQITEWPEPSAAADKADLVRLLVCEHLSEPQRYRANAMDLLVPWSRPLFWLNARGVLQVSLTKALCAGTRIGAFRPIERTGRRLTRARLGKRPVGRFQRMGPRRRSYALTMIERHARARQIHQRAKRQAEAKIRSKFPDVHIPSPAQKADCSWHRMPVLTADDHQRSALLAWLRSHDIEGSCSWPLDVITGNVTSAGERPQRFPNSLRVAQLMINVPVWSEKIWDF